METEYVAIAGNVTTLLVFGITQFMNNRSSKLDRRLAMREQDAARSFAARESRFDVRREAISRFYSSVLSEQNAILDFERSHKYDDGEQMSPGDIGDELEYAFPELNSAYGELVFLLDDDLRHLAKELRELVIARFYDADKDASLDAKLNQFVERAAKLLVDDSSA